MLCMPVGRDQPDTAARVVACGAGLRLRPGAGTHSITRALKRILTEPSFRNAAGKMSEAIATDYPEDTAVKEIETAAKSRQQQSD